jgi:arylsulfatase A-like enzyme
MPTALAQKIRRSYYATISYTDLQLGRLLDGLDQLGLTSTTVVLMFGDHGQQLGEMDLWEKMTNYEVGTRVPFILRAPWKTDSVGKSTDAIVEIVDAYKTLVELAGLPPPPAPTGPTDYDAVQGKSLVALLDAMTPAGRERMAREANANAAFALSQMTRCQCSQSVYGSPTFCPCLGKDSHDRAYDWMGYR